MSTAVSPIQVKSNNTCPHGLPPGACPICNGGGAGGGRKVARNTQEWSYAKCMAAGMAMRASEARAEANKAMFQNQLDTALKVREQVTLFLDKAQELLKSIQAKLPLELQATFNNVVVNVINPVLKLISNIPLLLDKLNTFINDVRNKILAVAEKLNAIIGEIKNFVERNIVDKFKKLTKKLISFFIFGERDENYQNDEELEIFKSRELRKLHKAILRLKNKKDEEIENA